MGRVCTVCSHPERAEIDAAAIAGASYRTVAHRFHVTRYALMRHKADHVLPELVKAKQAEDVSRATDLLEMATTRDKLALALLAAAQRTGDLKTAVSALRVSLTSLELLARLRGELNEQTTVNVLILPEYMAARSALVAALAPFPDARRAVVDALAAIEGGSSNGTNGQRGE
jgi:hypothetical protein